MAFAWLCIFFPVEKNTHGFLKISKDKVLSMLIKCQINDTTLRFQTSVKPEDLNQKLKNLFEITFDSKSSVDIFKRKLVNTLAIEFSKVSK